MSSSTTKAIQVALEHHKAGRLPQAEAIFQQILQAEPNHPDVLHFSGVIAFQSGRREIALEFISKAIRINPSGLMHYNLGLVLRAQGRLEAAIESYRQALALEPNYAEAHNNIGNAFKELGKLDEAIRHYRKALLINPDDARAHNGLGCALAEQSKSDAAVEHSRQMSSIKPDSAAAHYSMGNTLRYLGRLEEALVCYRRALQANPDLAAAHNNMGNTLRDMGRPDEALACYQQVIRLTPGNVVAQHIIASMTGNNTEYAPVQYVENLFDGYAGKFDTHLRQALKYEVPEKIVALVTQHSAPPAEKWNVLDLGCGTGLVGSEIAPFARHLVGVDLSARMLEKAHARNLYQRLERLDLLAMMRSEEASSYDVIIAADVFIYLGKLDEIICEIKRLLCPGGIFAFSIEALEALFDDGARSGAQREYQLENTGRYSHAVKYITRLAAANGFLPQEMAATQLRMENGKPVNGHLVLWQS